MDDTPPPPSSTRAAGRGLLRLGLLALVIFGSRSVIADWNYVPSGSMRPTILPGDAVFVNRMAYDIRVPFTRINLWHRGDPARGDIVILLSPADGQRLVKRVAGLPGDVIAARDGVLYVNGKPLDYVPAGGGQAAVFLEQLGDHRHPVMWSRLPRRAGGFFPRRVPAGHYFVLGDHRDNSADSRYFGFVPRELVLGRAVAVIASFDLEHAGAPRWDRFFTRLP